MTTESRARILAEFARTAPALPGACVPWLVRARQAALDRFAESGFPTSRDEEWKYTNVTAIEKRAFTALPQGVDRAATPAGLGVPGLGAFPGHRVLFVNGRYSPAHSSVGLLPAGVILESLADTIERSPDALQLLFGEDSRQTVFGALNSAFMADGLYLYLPRGAAIEEPIHLFFAAGQENAAICPRNVIVAEEGAQATVIEHYAGAEGASYLTNAVTQILAATNARVEHYKLQQEPLRAFHIAGIHAVQGRGSRFSSHSISLGAALARNDITTAFDGEGCETALNGLYLARGRQHVDHHTRIDHAKPDGASREYYRGLLDGAARGVFNGKVIVHPQANGTDAHQLNRNLLLSKNAEVDAKPQLEIHADDVKCTHGATVGQLDEEQVFYLRSRGIEEGVAKSLIVYAFARDVIERIRVAALRERLEEVLLAWLPQGERIKELA
ncbi:MAG: Fe-S cluster assembly protein SufD [Woeseiaceae bacterium]